MGGKGTFGPGTARNPTGVGELDGVWVVERVSGALPPLYGCVKRIHGSRGTTEFPHVPGVPFEVRGQELHYPLGLFVDKLEPRNGAYLGRATLLGRELGQFTMRRLDGMGQLQAELIKHIDEAHAMEQRLEAHDVSPSTVRQLGGVLGALAKMPLDFVRGEKAGRNARDAYATEHLEIASYELLRRVAQRAGDEETATAALEIIEEERAMALMIEQNWDKFAELSLREEGVTV